MKMRLLLLVACSVALWGILAGPIYLLLGEQHLLFSAVAAGLCLAPMMVTQVWCDAVLGKSPEQQLAAVMGGTAFRMVFVVGIGMVLFSCTEEFAAAGFWLWIIGFYLWTLTVEMVLVARRQTAMDRAARSNGSPLFAGEQQGSNSR